MANRAHNRISLIKDKRGNSLKYHEDIKAVLVQHFRTIAQETCYERDHYIQDFTKHITRIVSSEDNVNLYKPMTEEEDILQVVEDSRRHKTILKAPNSSFIDLIPKQEMAQTPNRFRPISLCNVIYKIISKVAANRLKPLLPSLVSGEQSGFVEGR
eukprot:PITA_34767